MIRTFAALILLLISFPASAQSLTGKVIHIADGDTITVLVDHQSIRTRLYGIDAPEKRQPFGTRAKQYAGQLAFGKIVTVIEHGHDRYGRTIGEVLLPDGRNLSREMTRAGLCWWFRKYAPHDAELERLEREAREARRGLWADRHPVAPWDFRESNAGKHVTYRIRPARFRIAGR